MSSETNGTGTDDTALPSSPIAGTEATIAPAEPGTKPTMGAPITSRPAPASLPTVEPSQYLRGVEIARGGMGRIIEAHDRRLGRPVAVKELLHSDEDAAARFEREALITAQLQHPAIVAIYEAGRWPTGEPFYAMKRVIGRSFDKVIAEATTLDHRLALVPSVVAVFDALAYAHDRKIIHRDLKPANVLVGAFGEIVVIDWGLAKDLHAAIDDDRRTPYRMSANGETVAGAVMGTPAYMPPEQASGERVDARADVYALGAILYHVLAGSAPYEGKTVEAILGAVLSGPPTPIDRRIAGVPPDLVAIVNKAMAWRAENRYPTAAGLADDLKKFQTGQLVGAHRYSPWQLVRRWVRHHRSLAVAGAALMVLVVLGALGVVRIIREQSKTETQRQIAEQRLADVLRLADAKKVRDLVEEVDRLWPLQPDRAQAMASWMERARDVLGHRDQHAAALAHVRAMAVPPEAPWHFSTIELDWEHAVLVDILAGLDQIEDPRSPHAGMLAVVAQRYEMVTTLHARSLDQHATAWQQSIEAIAADPSYQRIRIVPQLGLVPLGPDPSSHLFEFAAVGTGSIPTRDPTGHLVEADDAAIVMVLIPPGSFQMGAQRVDPRAASFDPQAQTDESPVHQVALSAFFIAKYECTQAQWKTLTGGDDPSQYKAGQLVQGKRLTPRNPVEQVSWDEADRWMSRYGLTLPTESQWEYAARATTRSPWYAGDAKSLASIANIADSYLASHGGPANWKVTLDVDDGNYVHAPVGSFAPNRFGLHDMLGNVYEWCRDVYAPYPSEPGTDPVGPPSGEVRVGRGGSWSDPAEGARATPRTRDAKGTRNDSLGFRPSRTLSM